MTVVSLLIKYYVMFFSFLGYGRLIVYGLISECERFVEDATMDTLFTIYMSVKLKYNKLNYIVK